MIPEVLQVDVVSRRRVSDLLVVARGVRRTEIGAAQPSFVEPMERQQAGIREPSDADDEPDEEHDPQGRGEEDDRIAGRQGFAG